MASPGGGRRGRMRRPELNRRCPEVTKWQVYFGREEGATKFASGGVRREQGRIVEYRARKIIDRSNRRSSAAEYKRQKKGSHHGRGRAKNVLSLASRLSCPLKKRQGAAARWRRQRQRLLGPAPANNSSYCSAATNSDSEPRLPCNASTLPVGCKQQWQPQQGGQKRENLVAVRVRLLFHSS